MSDFWKFHMLSFFWPYSPVPRASGVQTLLLRPRCVASIFSNPARSMRIVFSIGKYKAVWLALLSEVFSLPFFHIHVFWDHLQVTHVQHSWKFAFSFYSSQENAQPRNLSFGISIKRVFNIASPPLTFRALWELPDSPSEIFTICFQNVNHIIDVINVHVSLHGHWICAIDEVLTIRSSAIPLTIPRFGYIRRTSLYVFVVCPQFLGLLHWQCHHTECCPNNAIFRMRFRSQSLLSTATCPLSARAYCFNNLWSEGVHYKWWNNFSIIYRWYCFSLLFWFS